MNTDKSNVQTSYPTFPLSRPRRTRLNPRLREMLQETILTANDLI